MTAMQDTRGPSRAPRRYKLTVRDYLTLAETGAFEALPKVELLDGEIRFMSPMSRTHGVVTNQLAFRLQAKLIESGSELLALIGTTATHEPHDAPEPDIALLQRAGTKYAELNEAPLVVEVAVTTIRRDLGRKKHMYAAASLPEYWVVDVTKARVHQFWSPQGEDFAESRILSIPGPLASVTMPELAIDTAGLL